MNHISYQLAMNRRDELLRQAAERRCAKQLRAAPDAASSRTARGGAVKLRLAWLHRFRTSPKTAAQRVNHI
jgi:hypothetical protein